MRRSIFCLILLIPVLLCAQAPKIIAYYNGKDTGIRQWPVEKITHIIYSFLKIQTDTLTFHNSEQEKLLQGIVALKKDYPALKIMVSVGGWGGCSFCSALFADPVHRKNFARTTVALFEQYGIDGLDLDWEYPAIEGYPGHAYSMADRENFTALVTELRQQMGKRYLLSFAAGGFVKYLDSSVNWQAVIPQVDFVNLMTYDLVGGYATVTGHHTPLAGKRPGEESTTRCVNQLLKMGIPSRKLIIGAATYARVWEQVPDTNHGLYQPGRFKRGVAYAAFDTYFSDSSGFRYYWDKKAKAPSRYNASAHLFATFDDPRSIQQKTKFIRKRELGGIMFWDLSTDTKQDGLLDAMYRGLY